MIRRETDAVLANRLTNMSETHGFMQRHGEALDWSPLVEAGVILSNGDDACMLFEQTDARDWQVTTCYAPTCRGRRAVETGVAMKEWMRDRADMIFGSVPNGYRHAQWFYRRLGGIMLPSVVSGGVEYEAQPDETLLVMRY